jgi:transketolase
LILSRQNIKDIPSPTGSRLLDSVGVRKGGYLVHDSSSRPDVILLANGSEVSTLMEAAVMLEKENALGIRVVSVPSEGLFRQQSEVYQNELLLPDVPVFGLTAGLPVTLEGLTGKQGRVFGLNHFGYSAPYTVLDEKFGFTPVNVVAQVLDFLGKKA